MSIDHSGPAFPSPDEFNANGARVALGRSGMTLRQWYASQALAGMAPTPSSPMGAQGVEGYRQQYQGTAHVLATVAFAIADAMIQEGNKP